MANNLLLNSAGLLEAVKIAVRVKQTDPSRDAALTAAVAASKAHVLRRTRYAESSASGVTAVFRRVRLGSEVHLPLRPVSALTIAEVKSFGGEAWTTLTGELLDGDDGLVMIVGTADLGATWPSRDAPSRSFRWRADPIWDMARFTYDTAVGTIPEDLDQAAVELAIHWFTAVPKSPLKSQNLGGVSEVYSKMAIPPHVTEKLAPYVRRKARVV